MLLGRRSDACDTGACLAIHKASCSMWSSAQRQVRRRSLISLGSASAGTEVGTCRMSVLKPFAYPPGADTEKGCCEPESRHQTAHNQISKVIDNMNTAAVTNEATIPNRTAFVVDIKLPPWKWAWAPTTENVRRNKITDGHAADGDIRAPFVRVLYDAGLRSVPRRLRRRPAKSARSASVKPVPTFPM